MELKKALDMMSGTMYNESIKNVVKNKFFMLFVL